MGLVLAWSLAALLLVVLGVPVVAATGANAYPALPNLCSKIPGAAISAALGVRRPGRPR